LPVKYYSKERSQPVLCSHGKLWSKHCTTTRQQ